MKKLQRVLALIMAIVMMMGTMSMTAFATEGEAGTTAPEISTLVEKSADGLDANDQTNVTLTVPGMKQGIGTDIVFVMGSAVGASENMLTYLKRTMRQLLAEFEGTGAEVKLGLVCFENTTERETVLPLQALKEETMDQVIADALAKYETDKLNEYGIHVNMESSLQTAKDMLDADTTVPAERKHLILMSTGYSWTFDDEKGNAATIVGTNYNGYPAWGQMFYVATRNRATGTSYLAMKVPFGWSWNTYWNKIKNWVETDKDKYVFTLGYNELDENGNVKLDEKGNPIFVPTTYEEMYWASDVVNGETVYNNVQKTLAPYTSSTYRYGLTIRVPKYAAAAAEKALPHFKGIDGKGEPSGASAHAINYERSMYDSYKIFEELREEGTHCYAITTYMTDKTTGEPKYVSTDTVKYFGDCFMDWMNGGDSPRYSSSDEGKYFDPIHKEIIYSCSDGSKVTDYIGKNENGNFEFIQDAKTISVTYGTDTYKAKQIDTKEGATASYTFGTDKVSFELDYFYGDGETTERLEWTFHEDVSLEKKASLTYKLQLTGKKTTDGAYTVPTNNSAYLDPKDSKGEDGDRQYFPVPEVEYEVVSKVTISGVKEWNDDEDRDGKRPERIKVILLANGEPVAEKVLTSADAHWTHEGSWAFEFKDMPAKDESGKTIDYTVDEAEVPEGYEKSVEGFVIENTHTPETITISGTKIWDDDSNRDGKRPASIIVALMKGDDVVETKEVTAANQWTYSFTAYKYENGEEITNYSVKEIDVPADYEDTYSEENFDITNTYEPETITIEGKKVWDDANNQDGKRPTSIIVKLMDGETVVETKEVKAADGWAFSFTAPKYKDGGVEIAYTVIEDQEALKELGYSLKGIEVAEDGFVTITNAYTPGKTSVTVTKVWDDADNHDGKRPANVTVQLLADGQAVEGKTVVLSKDNNWTATFADLDEYKNGQKIAYSVEEPEVPEGYTSSKTYSEETGIWTITNSRGIEKVTVDGLKVWSDNEDQDGARPASITVKLMDGETVVATQTVTADTQWAFSFTANKYKTIDGETVEIEYTVEEVVPEGYKADVTGNMTDGFTITNTKTSYEQVTVSGRKVWDDGNDRDGLRPTEINVKLFANGEYTGKMVTTNLEMDTWTFMFEGLDANKNGQPIVYTVAEETVPNGYTATEGTKENGYKITNTHTPATVSVEGQKIWNDGNDQDGLRPDSITIKLLADGEQVATQTVTAESQWTFEFTNLPKFNNGETIVYSISEDAVTGYDAPAIAGSVEDGFTITNKHTPATVSVEGTKTWNDGSDRDGIRPDEITIRLKADGAEIDSKTVTGEGNVWTYSFDNLPKYRDGGVDIVYSITEDAVENYTTTRSGYDVTNTYAPGKTSVSVSKIWDDGEDYDGIRPEEITVILLANGEATDKTVTLNADNRWTAIFTDLFAKEAGENIVYTVAEVEVEGYETEITGDATIGFTITNTHEPNYYEEDVVTVRKVWSGDIAANRPASVTVQLKNSRTGAVQATATLSAANGWSATFYVPANEFWTVEEVNVPANYTSRVSSPNGFDFTVTNTYTTQIEEPRVPMGTPGGDTVILDDDVPLADVPKTGDPLTVMAAMSILSGAGVFFTRKKREDEE